MTTDYYDEI